MLSLELVEKKDGLLISLDETIVKVRDPELLPENLKPNFEMKDKIQYKKIDFGLERVTIRHGDRKAVFDSEQIDYIKDIGRVDCFLSSVPLPGEIPTYPLFIKYRWGWVVFAPLEVA